MSQSVSCAARVKEGCPASSSSCASLSAMRSMRRSTSMSRYCTGTLVLQRNAPTGMRCTITTTLFTYFEMRSGVCGQRGSGGKALSVAAEAMPHRSAPSSFARRFTSAASTGERSGVPRRRARDMRPVYFALMPLPKTRAEIRRLQSERKRAAVERALLSPFWKKRIPALNPERLDDPDVWRKIPILDKDTLRALSDAQFYGEFCLMSQMRQHDFIQEFWRSGGVTGAPLFYPRSFKDMEVGLEAFARTFDCAGAGRGERAHVSFPMGIHPVGQVYARCAGSRGITVNWAGSGASTPSALQLELIQRLKP